MKTAPTGFWTVNRIAIGLGLAAGLAVVLTLGDPGITIDEPLDVAPGQRYLKSLGRRGWHFFDREVVTQTFADNAEHPPLGRWLLGIASTFGQPFDFLLGGPDPFGVHAGRLAPAACFAILVGLVSAEAGRRYGRAAGVAAGISLVLMPRVFAHAHFGALDTFLALFWTAALLAMARAVEGRRPVLAMAGAGLVWGLALLTKIHAWLLPPVVLAWALFRLRSWKALVAVAAWTASGLVVYVAGWPWLWYDSWGRFLRYVGTGVERLTLYTTYSGRVYADRDVPWHYPWVYFAVTVPVGLHLLGVLGLIRGVRGRRADPFPLLLAGSIGLFLVLFSTRIPVYDGERLFLTAFPLWAMLIGLGFQSVWTLGSGRRLVFPPLPLGEGRGEGPPLSPRPSDPHPNPLPEGEGTGWGRLARGLLIAVGVAQAYGLIATHPFGLSYYNALVGGLPGAERLGLELTYWGDSVDPILLDELAAQVRPGQTVALVPTLHHIQAVAATTPALLAKKITLQDESAAPGADWVVVYRRTAYWKPETFTITRTSADFKRSRRGVWLAGVWRRAPP